jgi:hypothetical protein
MYRCPTSSTWDGIRYIEYGRANNAPKTRHLDENNAKETALAATPQNSFLKIQSFGLSCHNQNFFLFRPQTKFTGLIRLFLWR